MIYVVGGLIGGDERGTYGGPTGRPVRGPSRSNTVEEVIVGRSARAFQQYKGIKAEHENTALVDGLFV